MIPSRMTLDRKAATSTTQLQPWSGEKMGFRPAPLLVSTVSDILIQIHVWSSSRMPRIKCVPDLVRFKSVHCCALLCSVQTPFPEYQTG